jgi:hypothetical protein
MLYRGIIAANCYNHKKYMNTLCWQNADFLNGTARGTRSYHWALKMLSVCVNYLIS